VGLVLTISDKFIPSKKRLCTRQGHWPDANTWIQDSIEREGSKKGTMSLHLQSWFSSAEGQVVNRDVQHGGRDSNKQCNCVLPLRE